MSTLLKIVTLGLSLLLAPQLAGAALIAAPALVPAGGVAPDHNIDTLSLTLALTIDTSIVGETGLTYDLTLNADAAAEWTVVDFAIIRDWSEGAASGLSNTAGWADPTTTTGNFLDWTGDAASALTEGETASFAYTVAGDVPVSQLFVYYVTKDGGVPFQVMDNTVPTLLDSAQVIVPEPTALALVGGLGLSLWGLRRGTPHG